MTHRRPGARLSSVKFGTNQGRRVGVLFGLLFLIGSLAACTNAPATGPIAGQKYEGTEMGGDPAPDFRLTDQRGESLALSDFRGKVVALTFFDSQCADVCPLTAVELRHAASVLGPENRDRVAWLAVNVNDQANTPADLAAFTEQNKLDQLAHWHFLTGAPPQLAAVAKDYYVYAERSSNSRVDHTPGIFIIDPDGRRRRYLDVSPELTVDTRPGDLLAQQMQRYLA